MFLHRAARSSRRRLVAPVVSQFKRASAKAAFASNQKSEGTIEEIFSSFHETPPFPERFAYLKKELWTEGLVESWREVLKELEGVTANVIARGSKVRPNVLPVSLRS